MTNNKLYGYTPKTSNEKDGNRLDRLNPYEFRKGMDYELVSVGCSRLAESTLEERETATEKVIKNLQEYGGYYSALIQYETEYRNPVEGVSKPSFKTYLKEMQDYQMIEVNKTYSNDKMTEPKYKKEDYTTQFKTDKMGKFKLKALKEAIKKEIQNNILNENIICDGWFDCPPCGGGGRASCKKDGVEVNSTDAGGTCGCDGKLSTDNRGGSKDIPTHGNGPNRKSIRNEIENLNEIENCDDVGNDCSVQIWVINNTGGGQNETQCGTVGQHSNGKCYCMNAGACGKVGVGGNDVLDADRTATKDIPTHGTGPTNPNYVTHRGSTQYGPDRKSIRNEIKNKLKRRVKNILGEAKVKAMANCTTPCPGGKGFTGGSGCPKCGAPGNVGKSQNEEAMANCTTPCPDGGFTGGSGCPECGAPGNVGKSKKSKSTLSKSETVSAIAEAIKNLKEAKSDVYDMDDAEPTKSQIKGIDKSIGDAKEALAQAIKKIKELGPDIKKLAKETNDKIKKNPAGKADYLKTYTTNPDVKEFIKLRKMLKSADLL